MTTDKRPLLLKCLRRYADAAWLSAAFDVLKGGLETLDLESDHPALSMTVGTNGELNVNIGQRWVWKANGDATISYILPLGADAEALGADSIMNPYMRGGQPEALWASFPFDAAKGIAPALRGAWIAAMEDELRRTKKSGFKKHHSPLFWEMVMLTEVREELFGEAFGESAAEGQKG